ncbi:Nif3-like dinuclear metal center hexameric protein [Alkaliphilus peptidifermentans]|uniref:GTP cyclohydrolase 1 type 2 homolog n=1 Tax=Alkaliphilus peptidifermentans DSM 18978 TaxID=1120976 RepID=A0A1G5GVM9_9FIRM|nr:Nif3-like dinuclear metal center hexameric protein [Alkaliphilus peptidifermentans]SCY55534.1 Putative GTP cyclohydrolase 1 type 2, NIF3 family [Alkaliphilus peptidifermentans DSM 18978]
MNKIELIQKLNEDFKIYMYHDVWTTFEDYTNKIQNYIHSDYQEYACGLMIDFADEISEVLTTTFITEDMFTFIKENNKKDILIFTHHPYYQKILDYSWQDAISDNIDTLKENRISIYVCHMALDFHPKYSTAFYLAKELMCVVEGRLSYEYKGLRGKVECEYYGRCIDDLFDKISEISSKAVFYQFNDIKPTKICCSPGGGNIIEIIRMAKDLGVDTYITGVSEFKGKNSISRNKNYFQQLENIGINIIGLGHYQTESLAMKALVEDYFKSFIDSVTYYENKYYI